MATIAANKMMEYYVSPLGNDLWSGRLAEPDADASDGPFATIPGARNALRRMKQSGSWEGPVTVWVREGRYFVPEPIIFDPTDSAPVTYAAYPGERAVIDGGRRIEGWRQEAINGRQVWVAHLPEVAEGKWFFRQLFVEGFRRKRPRWPKEGFFRMENVPDTQLSTAGLFDGTDTFVSAAGDMASWHNLQDVEVIVFHWWVDERMPVSSYDDQTRTVRCSRESAFVLKTEVGEQFANYHLENVFEALSEPGEWYLDRFNGNVYYLPLPGEQLELTEIIAPVAEQLLVLEGNPVEHQYVEHLRFQGLEFIHTDWRQPSEGIVPFTHIPRYVGMPVRKIAGSPQAALFVPGAIYMKSARFCSVEDCIIRHIGHHGVEIAEGCSSIRIVGNEMGDLGAGGVKINGSDATGPVALRTGRITVTDNHIYDGGNVFYNACGILSMHAADNIFSHNHIHHLVYSGISCGWVWGYADNVSKNNRIEHNIIHDLGFGLMSDLGGIYTLGVQPGTVIKGNRIHDIDKKVYGGWGIYLDEGSSHIIVEQNICYNTSSQGFNQHYGRENIVRDNIFAFSGEGQISFPESDHEGRQSVTFMRNIVVSRDQSVFTGGNDSLLEQGTFYSDLNLFWDTAGKPLRSGNGSYDERAEWVFHRMFDWEQWQALGHDCHSVVADPGFSDVHKFDFNLRVASPAMAIGFRPLDISGVGPRKKKKSEGE